MERRSLKLHAEGVLAYVDIPENPKGVIHFIHGMMEEIGDYEFLSDQATQKGYIFVRQEIAGHGDLAVDGKKGYMGKSPDGWNRAVRSIQDTYHCIMRTCEVRNPYFMVGFSLGSFLVREACLENFIMPCVDAVCLIGTGNKSLAELKIAEVIAKRKCKKYGEDNDSGVVDDLMMGNYNRKIKNEKGQFRWLFSSAECAGKFDPHGYVATPQLLYDFVRSMERVRTQAGSLSTLPVLLMSGKEDPVTEDMASLVQQFMKMGCKDVKTCVIPGKRHHILRDADEEESLKPFWEWTTKISQEVRSQKMLILKKSGNIRL